MSAPALYIETAVSHMMPYSSISPAFPAFTALTIPFVTFTLFPKKDPVSGYVMGSVGFRNITFYNAVPAALAPLILLPLSFYINE